VTWSVETLDGRVDKEILSLPADIQARFLHVAERLETHGPDQVGMPLVRSLGRGLWEMRLKGKDGIARAIYVKAAGKRLIVVHAFAKKTQKTPRRALETALARAKEVK
jgi:phage-related protein